MTTLLAAVNHIHLLTNLLTVLTHTSAANEAIVDIRLRPRSGAARWRVSLSIRRALLDPLPEEDRAGFCHGDFLPTLCYKEIHLSPQNNGISDAETLS